MTTPSDAQRWVLATASFLTEINDGSHELLGGAPRLVGAAAHARMLHEVWGIATTAELLDALAGLAAVDDDVEALAYHLGRLALLAGYGYSAYLLDATTAWKHMLAAARRVQRAFASFADFGKSFVRGRDALLGELDETRRVFDRLHKNPDGPWRSIPFATDLRRVPVPIKSQRTIVVAKQGVADARTIGEALAQASTGDRIVVSAGTYRERVRISTKDWDDAPPRVRGAVPRAPSVEIVGRGRVTLVSSKGPVVEVSEGGVLLEGIAIVNDRGKAAKGSAGHAVEVVDGFARLVGCTIRAPRGFGVVSSEFVQLADCTVDGCDAGVVAWGTVIATGGEVRRSRQENVTASGKHAQIRLDGVRVRDGKHSGVHAHGGTLVARDCAIERHGNAGAHASEKGTLVLERCAITKSSAAGIAVQSRSTATVIGTEVTSSGGNSVEVAASRDVMLEDCRLLGAAHDGVSFGDKSSGILRGCEIRGSRHVNMRVEARSAIHVADCVMRDSRQGSAVFLHEADATFEHCTFAGNRLPAIEAAGPSRGRSVLAWFGHCTIIGGRGDGVWVHGKLRARFSDCTIRGARGPGVRITERADPTLLRCRIEANGEAGVAVLFGGRAIVSDCTIHRNKGAGIEIGERSAAIVRGTEIRGGDAGVFVHDRGAIDVEGCDIGLGRSGVNFEGSGGRVAASWIHDARVDGICCVDRACPQIDGCDISGNRGAGIAVETGSAPHVTRCRVGGGKHGLHVYLDGRGTFEDCAITGKRWALLVEEGRPRLRRVHLGPRVRDPEQTAVVEDRAAARPPFAVRWTWRADLSPFSFGAHRTRSGGVTFSLTLSDAVFGEHEALARALEKRKIEPNGYGIELLVRALVDRDAPELAPSLHFDSEAGMLSVSSADHEALVRVAALLREGLAHPARACRAIPRGART